MSPTGVKAPSGSINSLEAPCHLSMPYSTGGGYVVYNAIGVVQAPIERPERLLLMV